MPKMPQWRLPENLDELVANGDGFWEDGRWEPILLTVMSGTSYEVRDIPLSWQIEFDPSDDAFDSANERLDAVGIDPDGYGWGQAIRAKMNDKYPALSEQLHFDDCEAGTCIVWAESGEACRRLLETSWQFIFEQ